MIKSRYGGKTHIIVLVFGLFTNIIVTLSLLLGGTAVLTGLVQVSTIYVHIIFHGDTMEMIRYKIHNNVMINYDKIDDQGLSPEFASMLLVVLIGGYTLVGGLGVLKSLSVFQITIQQQSTH